ncbi:MAG: GNAT family N-acetyltransferase [Steroidobacteraceae bacterium]
MKQQMLEVTYMELLNAPTPARSRFGPERVAAEQLGLEPYLALYRRVGEPLRWDQRLRMPRSQLRLLLESGELAIYVLRNSQGDALGLCEFSRADFPQIELKNFGLIPEAYGQGLGPWLLGIALEFEWQRGPSRIWLHTDTWDHSAAVPVYQKAGFRIVTVKREPVDEL